MRNIEFDYVNIILIVIIFIYLKNLFTSTKTNCPPRHGIDQIHEWTKEALALSTRKYCPLKLINMEKTASTTNEVEKFSRMFGLEADM